jgi:hypothetical protein
VGEVHRAAVHQDEIHLGMWNTARFDGVLDRARAIDFDGELAFSLIFREKVVELLVETEERGGALGHLSCPDACRTTPIVRCRSAATMA